MKDAFPERLTLDRAGDYLRQHLGRSPSAVTLWRWAKMGKLECERPGHQILVTRRSLEELVQQTLQKEQKA